MDTPAKDRPRVLLIEDNPGDARLFREILGESDYEVDLQWEESMAAGMRVLEEARPDLIVTDLGLPDSGGLETVEQFVEAAPDLPVVVLTGQQTLEPAMASLDAGATEYLRKDELMPGLVARTLQTAVERKRVEARLRQQEAALRRSQKRYRSLFRDSSDAILVHDLEGRIQEANPKAESLFDLSAEALRERSVFSLRVSEVDETAQRRWETLQAGEDPFRTVSRFERADGTEFWGELSANTIQIGDESMVRTLIRDVTERKEAEKALRESEELHRATLSNITDTVLIARDDGTLTYVCPNVDYIFGYDEEEVEKLGTISALFGSDPAEGHDFEGAQEISNVEQSVLDASGERHDLLINIRRVSIQGGTLMYTCRDITERKEAERELERQNDLFAKAQEIADVGAWEYDMQTEEALWTDEVFRIHGLPTDVEPSPETSLEHYHPDDRPTIRKLFRRAIQEGKPYDVELRLITEAGEQRWIRTQGDPQVEEGEVIRVRGTIQDVTGRKEVEESLREQEAQLRSLANSIPGAIYQFTVRPDWTYEIDFLSKRVEDLLGIPANPDAFFERGIERVPESHRETLLQVMTEAIQREEGLQLEIPFEKPSGEQIWVLTAFSAPERRAEELVFNGVFLDITERKEAEQNLRERNRQLQQIRENVTEVVWMSTPEKDEMEFITEAYEDIWGRPTQELREKPTSFVDAIHPEDRDRVRSALEIQQTDPEAYEETYRIVQPDGEVRWVRDKAAGVYDEDEQLERIVGVATDITERKRREQALKERQRKVESLYRATNHLLLAQGSAEVADRFHELLQEVFDFPLHGINFAKDGRLVPERSALEDDAQLPDVRSLSVGGTSVAAQAYRKGETMVIENVHDLDNEIDYGDLCCAASVPVGEHGAVVIGRIEEGGFDPFNLRLIEILAAHAATVLDRIEREEVLREERDLLDRVFETSPAAIVVLSAEGEIIRVSGRTEDIFGIEREEVTGRIYKDLEVEIANPDGSPILDEDFPFVQIISTGEPVYDVEHAVEWPDGTRRLLSVSGAPLTTADGELEGAVFHLEDITERRNAERELQETKQLLEKTFESLNEAVLVVDPSERRIIMCNAAVEQIFGYEKDELIGKTTEVLHVDRQAYERFGDVSEAMLDREGSFRGGYQMSRKDGRVIDTDHMVTPLQSEKWPQRVVSVVRDVSERKERERKLREAKEEAEEASQLKSAMLTNMSHEIRTPLTAITGFAELLSEELTGRLREFAERIERSGQRLMRTLDSVLQLSKLEAGAHDLEREPLQLEAIVRETAEMIHSTATEKSITVETSLPEGPVTGRWNEGALNRIVENLLENAIKFTPEGGRVDLRVREEGEEAVLEVEDTGIGIGEAALPNIFEAFKQESEGLGREYEGTGLGLSIVKKLTEALSGTVDVESEKGEGTCFTVRLPLRNSTHEEEA